MRAAEISGAPIDARAFRGIGAAPLAAYGQILRLGDQLREKGGERTRRHRGLGRRNRGYRTNGQARALDRRFIGFLVNGPSREKRGARRRSAVGCDPHGRVPSRFGTRAVPAGIQSQALGRAICSICGHRALSRGPVAFRSVIARARRSGSRAISAAIRTCAGTIASQETADDCGAARFRDARRCRHRRAF
jgi:hypothetical protein